MDTKAFLETLKANGQEAAYRVASTQMTSVIRKGLLSLFKDKGFDDSKMSMIEEVLDSDVGNSLIALILGYGLAYVPHYNEDPRVSRLAEEFRVTGMACAGNFAMDTAFQYFIPVIAGAVANLPEAPKQKVRVEIPLPVAEEEQEEDENEKASLKKANSGK